MKVVAIIPARGGSKGIPGKNTYPILGKPLIIYTIEAALKSGNVDAIWVSSDDDAILELCAGIKGVKTHKRSVEIAQDNSPVTKTVEAILGADNEKYDAILILQPTSPIRTGKQIDEAIELLYKNKNTNSVISVCAMNDLHPARMYWKNAHILTPIIPELEQVRRQDIPPAYYRNGCIYLVRKKAFLHFNEIMAKPIVPYVMPTNWLLNIDEPRDLLIAEALIPAWKNGKL